MNMEQYHYLRECELDAAFHQAKRDYQDGNFVTESVEDHLKRISHDV
jgi:hypothetical protein